ncbi:MAG: right-handed parallel beta-helix repeat-containing protein [Myxococcales bacterium]|jgi:hypothetical protein|nr:right-handed parallel beta-helix repeat-containing protein [Myxococcales bacterium]
MATKRKRAMSGSLAVFLLVAAYAASAAAATVLYVDDTPANNGAVSCPPSPQAFPDLQSAVLSLGSTTAKVTINVCPGIYPAATNAITLLGFAKTKVLGLGAPIIDATGFSGNVITVSGSTDVTVSGLVFSGGSNLGGDATAIEYVDSTGTITKNLVTEWHQDFYQPLTAIAYGITTVATDPAKTVKILGNTVFDVQDNGIVAVGPARAKIAGNRVVLHSDIDPKQYFAPGPKEQAGILLLGAGAGSAVVGNAIESNAGMEPRPCAPPCMYGDVYSRGIFLLQTSGAKVSGNTVSYLGRGISIESWCYNAAPSGADGNVVSKNRLYNNRVGFSSELKDFYGSGCSPHANANVVTGNRFDRSHSGAAWGAFLAADSPATIAGDVLTGNTFTGYYKTIPLPFDTTIGATGSGVSGLVTAPNTVRAMPLLGPLR